MADYAPPSSRVVNWTAGTYAGVPGGLYQYRPGGASQRTTLIDVTQSPYNADNTGTVNAASAIQSAVNAASAGQVVYLPAGTYLFSTQLDIATKKNITIRGAGIGQTLIRISGNVRISIGSGSDYQWSWPTSNNTITAGLTKGSTEVTIGSTSAFSVGQIVQLKLGNVLDNTAITAGAVPHISVGGYSNLRRQKAIVTAKTSTTLTFTPPIVCAPGSGVSGTVNVAQFQSDRVGIEDLEIDMDSCTNPIPVYFGQCYACWLYRVKATNTPNYHVFFTDSAFCEMRRCWLDGRKVGGSNGSSLLMGSVSACLFEHNVIARVVPCVEVNFGCHGNVFRFNVFERATGAVGGTINTNHAPHNTHNLWECNITNNIQCDGYYGSGSEDMFLRNWINGAIRDQSSTTFKVSLNRFTRDYSFVGNINGWSGYTTGVFSFGNPNMGNGFYDGDATPTSGDFWNDWKATGAVTTRLSATTGTVTLNSGSAFTGQLLYLIWPGNRVQFTAGTVSGGGTVFSVTAHSGNDLPAEGVTVDVFMGPGGYQELDHDVQNSTLLKGNYYAASAGGGAIPGGESLGADTLPVSFAGGQPIDWPAGFTYPPIDPIGDPAASQNYERLPAGYWLVNGVWPGEEPTPAAPVITQDPATQTVDAGSDVTLSANATGNPSPTWSWTKNGASIPSATTRFLVLLDVTEASEGSYVATATNSEGSDSSAAAVLTVNPEPPSGAPSTPHPLGNLGCRAQVFAGLF